MTDPDPRLLDEGTETERRLLRAGRDERAPERTLEKTLLAIAATSGVIGAGTAAGTAMASGAAVKGSASASLTAIALKWLGIGAVGGLVTMSGVQYVTSRSEEPPKAAVPTSAPVEVATRAPVAAPVRAEPAEPTPAPIATAVPERARSSAPPASSAPPEEPSISAELTDIDAARSALAAGNHATALGRLDAWERRPGKKALGQEALFLRMQALSLSGQRAKAEDAARRLLAASPNGPHAARARALLASGVDKK